jgi:hypothetical protein
MKETRSFMEKKMKKEEIKYCVWMKERGQKVRRD